MVSSDGLMPVLFHAGLPCGDYCYGGKYFESSFVLDEHDQLTEYAPGLLD